MGRYVQIPQFPGSPRFEIVGLVQDVKPFTVEDAPTADLYIPLAQMPASQAASMAARMYWVIRTDRDPRQIVLDVRQAVHASDPDIATSSVRTLDEVLERSLSGRRANVRLLEVFGQVAMLLAAIGVYAIAAFSAGARRRELAIRAAFGAGDRDLVRLVLAAEYRPVFAGIVAGLVCARLVAGSLGGVLFSVGPSDAVTYVVVASALLALTFAATLVPAVRAGHADPAELLRS